MLLSAETFTTAWWIYLILVVAYFVTILSTVIVIISENRNPVKSLAWVTVLLLLPVVGLIFYIIFGRNITNTRMISRRNRRRLRRKESYAKVNLQQQGLELGSIQLIQLTRTLAGAQFYPGNHLKIFTNGHDKFEALIRDINEAHSFVNIQYYIFLIDSIGSRVSEALVAAAHRGVKVRFIYDHVGSYRTPDKYIAQLKREGVEAYPFFKVAFPPFGTRINWRNHRKICIIDGAIGYIGGMNIADRYIDGGKKFACWRDTHLRITGPAVRALQYSFAVDWNFMGLPLIEDKMPDFKHAEGIGMQMLSSGPTLQWTNQAMLFLKAISSATKRVYIQTPYFLPTEALLRALQTASLSGVDVRIMLPLKSDSDMLDYGGRSYFTECLQASIKIYLYKAGMLHSKMVIIDDEFVSVGSSNFDFRSFEHNFEANMQIYSRQATEEFASIFYYDITKSVRIKAEEWKHRSRSRKAAESLVRLLSPIL